MYMYMCTCTCTCICIVYICIYRHLGAIVLVPLLLCHHFSVDRFSARTLRCMYYLVTSLSERPFRTEFVIVLGYVKEVI